MFPSQFVLKSIWHYRKLNLTVVMGIALCTAIILGALIIGDSVQFSLQQITTQRLGRTSLVVTTGERLFGKHLSEEISKKSGIETTSLLRSTGIAVIDGGKFQLNQLAVWGVEPGLDYFSDQPGTFDLKGNEAAINENLATLAGIKAGDEILLRVNQLNTFPANTPFVASTGTSVAFRVLVKRILKPHEMGNFSLLNVQSAPRNIFLNLNWLNDQMKLKQKANVLLVSQGTNETELNRLLQQSWTPEDLNLTIHENQSFNYTELVSDRVFIEPTVEEFCIRELSGSYPVFSYFINDFSFRRNHTPYSFVSTDTTLSDQQIRVSQWLADDLKLKVKDTVRLSYFEIGPLRKLIQKESAFVVENIYGMEGSWADPSLMPQIPGLSDAGNCRDWKTGVPVDLQKIRTQDESYWKQYKGTPKAIVSLQTAKKIWGNRFGRSTAIRVSGLKANELTKSLLAGLSPAQTGIAVKNARSEGLTAAANGVDFGQLFIGLSFFVLVAAFLLAYLLFRLFLGFRKNETATLFALGFPLDKIRNLFLAEASVIVLAGILIGIPLGMAYNYLILKAINTIWFDIVGTSIAQIYWRPISIYISVLASIVIFMLTFAGILHRFLNNEVVKIRQQRKNKTNRQGKWSMVSGILLILVSVISGSTIGLDGEINPELFYISGFCLLPGLLLLLDYLLRRRNMNGSILPFSLQSLILKRLAQDRKRTLLSVSFLAFGIFLVVTTGLYRQDGSLHAELASSGTGGYDYLIETTLPVLFDPGTPTGKKELGLPADALTVAFHVQPGDDASCLNLNRITRPRIIACNPDQFSARSAFTFTSGTSELDRDHPWNSLNNELPDHLIPAFADQTVIQWGLGKHIGDTLVYRDESGIPLKIKLIGGLENSIFQGNIIITEDFFVKAFPSVSGGNMFLIKFQQTQLNLTDLQEDWRPYGPDIKGTALRLASFNRIENTYLNIFLMLGALGLLIGTIGLGVLIFRITLEQIPEFALLQSIGFPKSTIYRIIFTEKLLLIVASILIGIIPGTLSALPFLISSPHSGLWIWLPSVSLVVLIFGLISVSMAIKMALRNQLAAALQGS